MIYFSSSSIDRSLNGWFKSTNNWHDIIKRKWNVNAISGDFLKLKYEIFSGEYSKLVSKN